MKVLSLFDGMACGILALIKAEIEIESYDAFENNQYATKTATHNFPMIRQHGDVFNADFTQFKGVDLLCGGSPCTYWSIAQKNNRETEASGMGWDLFNQYVRAVKESQPKFFVYENNKSMSKAIRESIDKAFGFEAVLINSALVSAQNRQRLYWVGKRNADGTYRKVDIEQPEDKGILLKDILETGMDLTGNEKGYTLTTSYNGAVAWNTIERSQRNMVAEPVGTTKDEKSYCLTAYYSTGQNAEHTLSKGLASMVAEPVNVTGDGKSQTIKAQYQNTSAVNICCYKSTYGTSGVAEPIRIPKYGEENKSRPLGACYSKNCGGFEHRMFSENPNKQQVDMIAEPVRVGCLPSPDGTIKNSQAMRVYSVEGKAVNQTAQGGGMGGKTGLYAIPIEFEHGKPIKAIRCIDGKTYDVYEVKNGLITIKGKQYPIKLADGFYIIRKLTVRECMRLQTVPEWYEFPVSNSQAYKMLGNGWTVDVIAHIFKYLI